MAATEKKLKAIKDKQTQTQIISSISSDTGLANKDVKAVLEQLGELSHRHIMKRGSGEFKIPFLISLFTFTFQSPALVPFLVIILAFFNHLLFSG